MTLPCNTNCFYSQQSGMTNTIFLFFFSSLKLSSFFSSPFESSLFYLTSSQRQTERKKLYARRFILSCCCNNSYLPSCVKARWALFHRKKILSCFIWCVIMHRLGDCCFFNSYTHFTCLVFSNFYRRHLPLTAYRNFLFVDCAKNIYLHNSFFTPSASQFALTSMHIPFSSY
jgi:hypothetical protein